MVKCEKHPMEQLLFLCKSKLCSLPFLCNSCRKEHLLTLMPSQVNSHAASIITFSKAQEEAMQNLNRNKELLTELVSPFEKEKEIFMKIQRQKEELKKEKGRIMSAIEKLFDRQIYELDDRNRKIISHIKQKIPIEEIHQKIRYVEDLEHELSNDPKKIKIAISFSEDSYANRLKKQNESTYASMDALGSNEYYVYETTAHNFQISKLKLKLKLINNKLTKKVKNESELHFLIDDYQQGHFLHYFSTIDKQLRIYDIPKGEWAAVPQETDIPFPEFAATMYDHRTNRFYLVGGVQVDGNKSQDILWYDMESDHWQMAKMQTARSSAMVTIIESTQAGKAVNLLLIAGGIGSDRRHLKNCELFDPSTQKILNAPDMNFAITSGALVTFNGSIVFRIGGLGQYEDNSGVICEIAQKLDYKGDSHDKWAYIELQVVTSEAQKNFKLFYANQAAIQINPNEIFVFGGYTHNKKGISESYLIQVQKIMNLKNKQTTRYWARWINKKPLISRQGFMGLRPIIYNKNVMSLQNISSPSQNGSILDKEKKLIEFNMFEWYETENIVDI